MELLSYLKFSFNRQSTLSTILIHIMEISTLSLLVAKSFSDFYHQLFEITTHTGPFNSYFIVSLLLHNLFIITIVLASLADRFAPLRTLWRFLSISLKLFPFLVFVPLLNYCMGCVINCSDTFIRVCSLINIILMIGYLFLHQFLNESLKFREADFCNRRLVSYISPLILVVSIVVLLLFGPFYGSVVYILRSVLKAIKLFNSFEYKLVQRLQLFYSLFSTYIAVVIVMLNIQIVDSTVLNPLANSLIIIVGGALISWLCSQQLSLFIMQRLLARTQWGGERSQLQTHNSRQQGQLWSFQNELNVLVQVLLEREKSLSGLSNEYSQYWRFFNERVFLHKLKCEEPKCVCHSKQNQSLEKQDEEIYLFDVSKRIQNAGAVLSKQGRLKVLNIYLLIQIARKPLKGYYEVISLQREKNNMAVLLEIRDLVTKSRECFDQIYYKNKVQNQQLQLLKVIHCEEVLNALEEELKAALVQASAFLEIFTYSTVKMAQVQTESKKLFDVKMNIEQKLQQLASSSEDNGIVGLSLFIFYRLLEVYRSREAEFRKMGSQQVLKRRLQKSEDEVTEEQGVIYIDLVQQRGRIKKMTKNMSSFFGYSREDMLGFNINLFMPTIFGRHHAKFLSNFIDKGRIRLLKQKNRVVFGRNKRKFIFPVLIKLKTEHLQEDEFGASAVLTRVDSSSQFLLIGTHGKIEEITEGLYYRIFGRALREQVGKVVRLCGYKIIPSLNQVIEGWQEKDVNKIHEGLLLYSEIDEYLMQKFRYSRESGYNSLTSRTKSLSVSSKGSISGSVNSIHEIPKAERTEYFNELFRIFIVDLNPNKLKALRINYKYSRVKTAQFELELIEIVSIREQLDGREFIRELLSELTNVAEIYQLLEEHSPVSRHLAEMEEQLEEQLNIKRSSREQVLQSRVKEDDRVSGKEESVADGLSDDDFLQEFHQKANFNPQASEQSSVMGGTENESKKQLLINAFNSNESAVSSWATAGAHCILGLLLCLLALTTAFTFDYVRNVTVLWNDCSYLLQLRNTIQFRMGLSELSFFVQNTGLMVPADLSTNINDLNSKMLQIVKNLNTNITHNLNDFDTPLWLYDPNRQLNYSSTLSQTFSQLLWMFQQNSSANLATLRFNYQNIHNQLSTFYQMRETQLFQQNSASLAIVKDLFAVYETMLLLTALCSLPLYLYFKKQELNVKGKLAFMNMKEIRKAINKIKLTIDFLKTGYNQKGAMNRLQTELNSKRNELQEDASVVSRSIKLVSDNGESKVFLNPVLYLVLLAFVLFFSHLPTTFYALSQSSSDYFTGVVTANRLINQLQIKTPLLLNVYLSNINRVLSSQSSRNFSPLVITETNSGYFDLINTLSSVNYKDNAIVGDILAKATDPLCLILNSLNCSSQNNISLTYLSNSLRNHFYHWNPANGITLNTSSIKAWINEDLMQNLVDQVGQVLSLSDVVYSQVQNQFTQYLNKINLELIVLTAILIPVNFLAIVIILRKFLGLLNSVIKAAEKMFMHFPVNILVENTYLTSYFNSKAKHSK